MSTTGWSRRRPGKEVNQVSASSLKEQCKALKLAQIPGTYLEIDYHDREQYLRDLFEAELQARQASKIRRLIRQAGFLAHKTLEEFDWQPVTLPSSITITDLANLAFIDGHENVLALGAVGTGKTHLASALGIRAYIELGFVPLHGMERSYFSTWWPEATNGKVSS